MIVLAIDTCGPSGSIVLAGFEHGALQLLAQTVLAGKTYSAQLVPALRGLLSAQNLTVDDLAAIVIVNGPGSFTGIRIGVSSAKGLADALSIPVLAVSRLAVLAAKAQLDSAALDAGRGEFYLRTSSHDGFPDGFHESLVPATDLPTGSLAVCEPSALRAQPLATLVDPPTAADALTYAAPCLLAGDYTDPATLDGHYLRRSDAEIFAKTPAQPAAQPTVPSASKTAP